MHCILLTMDSDGLDSRGIILPYMYASMTMHDGGNKNPGGGEFSSPGFSTKNGNQWSFGFILENSRGNVSRHQLGICLRCLMLPSYRNSLSSMSGRRCCCCCRRRHHLCLYFFILFSYLSMHACLHSFCLSVRLLQVGRGDHQLDLSEDDVE